MTRVHVRVMVMLALGFVLSVLLPVGSNSPSVQAQALDDYCVRVYQHINGGGGIREECGGSTIRVASLPRGWNDEISSLSVGRWRSLKVYTEADFGGACKYISGGTTYANLSSIRIDWRKTWNDIISSYIINPTRGCDAPY